MSREPSSRVGEDTPLLAQSAHGGGHPARALPGYPASYASSATADAALPVSVLSGAEEERRRRRLQREQEAADEEMARRLAAEEEHEHRGHARERSLSDPRFNVFRGAGGGFRAAGGAAGVAPRAQVREAMMGELLSQRRFTQLSFGLVFLFNLPQLVLVLLYSVRYWNKWGSCDRPLNLWLLLYGARLLCSTVVASLPLLSRRRWHPRGEAYSRLYDTVNLFGFIVFILGNFWLFDSLTCAERNPAVYHLCFILLIVQYVIMMLPCLLLMCLAPMVFCCLPLLIRLSLFLPPGVGLRMLDQQGASENLISKLPPAKRFERGMLGSSENARSAAQAALAAATDLNAETSPVINHDEPECAICLSNYSVGELVRQLPCQGAHHFHDKCITDWLKIHATCPCCRESLLPLMADPALMRARVEEQARRPPAAAAASADERKAAVPPPARSYASVAGAAHESKDDAERGGDDVRIDIGGAAGDK